MCALPTALRGEVEAAVLKALGTGTRIDGKPEFFAPDAFRFGQPLERSEFEIAAQRATGVDGVVCTYYRRRGLIADFEPMPGRRMTGWVAVAGALTADEPGLRGWVARAFRHTAALPTKAGRKARGSRPRPRRAQRGRRAK